MTEDLTTFAATRDPALRSQLAVRHLPLVKFVARKMSANMPNSIDVDDLVSWGSMGLLDAIDKWDPERQVKFSTYAVTRIRGSILDGLQQMDWMPKQITSRVRAMRRTIEDLRQERGEEPTPEEIAERMEVSPAEVRKWLLDHSLQRVRTLNAPPVQDDPYGTTGDEVRIEGDQEIAAEVDEIRDRVAATLARLDSREQAVILLYYRDSLTLREIAVELGVSVSSATQTHTRLVEQVRARLALFGSVA